MEPFKLQGNNRHYLVFEVIGQGGIGTIFKAKELEQDRTVVIKRADPKLVNADEEMRLQGRQQQQRQVTALGRLDHPNVMKFYDQFHDEAYEYLVEEFIQGCSLGKILEETVAQGRLLEESRVIGWALQALNGLSALHDQSQPIVHRDLKPDNLMLDWDGRVVLVDFGLMKRIESHGETTISLIHAVGTVEYAPPEQYAKSGSHTDIRTDLYSLGATLYHLLAGQLPPRSVDRIMPVSILEDVAKRPPSICSLNPTVGKRTEQIVFKAMEVDPDQRYQSAEAMREDFCPRHHIIHLPF